MENILAIKNSSFKSKMMMSTRLIYCMASVVLLLVQAVLASEVLAIETVLAGGGLECPATEAIRPDQIAIRLPDVTGPLTPAVFQRPELSIELVCEPGGEGIFVVEAQRCSTRYPNCALCNEDQCLMCMANHTLQSAPGSVGPASQACVLDFCPPRTRMVSNPNGVTYCERCTTPKCSQCAMVSDSESGAETEVCLECEGGYKRQAATARAQCVSTLNSILLAAAQRIGGFSGTSTVVNFVVTGLEDEEAEKRGISAEKAQAIRGKEKDEEFAFLQQALHRLDELSTDFEEVSATIWIGKGHHFFFYCHGILGHSHEQNGDPLCQELPRLEAFQPRADNFELQVKALWCDDAEARLSTRAKKKLFERVCIPTPATPDEDSRPVIYVNGPQFYFNITQRATFKDLVFDGINAFSVSRRVGGASAVAEFAARPYWPGRRCKLDAPSSRLSQEGESPLLQYLKNDSDAGTKGYGYLPLKSLTEPELTRNGEHGDEVHEHKCAYLGDQANLYNRGANDEFNYLVDKVRSRPHTRREEQLRARRTRKEAWQGTMDYSRPGYNRNEFEVTGEGTQTRRASFVDRKALFNLYAFTFIDSFQKNEGPRLDGDDGEGVHPNADFSIPTLKLENVQVRNFLKDYDALIHVEKDNFILKQGRGGQVTVFQHGHADAEAAVVITNSEFFDSSFNFGLIYFPPQVDFRQVAQIVFSYEAHSHAEDPEVGEELARRSKWQKGLQIFNSTFINLNYGQSVSSLGKIGSNPFFKSRGILCTVHDFRGNIEFSNNTVRSNMVFIPSAILSNLPKMNEETFQPALSEFEVADKVDDGFFPEGTYLQFVKHEPHLGSSIQALMNFLHLEQSAGVLRDGFTTQSPMLFSNVESEQIIITGNTFDGNVGIHGGAIHIDLESRKQGVVTKDQYTPFILLKDNHFTRNTAYFDGNAVYLKGAQKLAGVADLAAAIALLQVTIEGCVFKHNYGLNVGFGAAVSIDGKMDDTYRALVEQRAFSLEIFRTAAGMMAEAAPSNEEYPGERTYGFHADRTISTVAGRILVQDCHFEENFAGQRAAALNLLDIERSTVEVRNTSFSNNTGAFSALEVDLPFASTLATGQFKLNFFDWALLVAGRDGCSNEFQMAGKPSCIMAQVEETKSTLGQSIPYRRAVHVQQPHMDGVIFIRNVGTVSITNCSFVGNDPGPVLDAVQTIGLLGQARQMQRTAAVSIQGVTTQVTLTHVIFRNNSAAFFQEFVDEHNPEMSTSLPPYYLTSSQAPLVSVHDARESSTPSLLHIANCTFKDQHNSEILGLREATHLDLDYYAALLHARTRNAAFEVVFEFNQVSNFVYRGEESSLIMLAEEGALTARSNVFYDIGRLSSRANRLELIFETLEFEDAADSSHQQRIGIFHLRNTGLKRGKRHLFVDNYFRRIYGHKAGVYCIETQSLEATKVHLVNNFYFEVFGGEAAVMHIRVKEAVRAGGRSEEQLTDANQLGLIVLENEVVTQSQVVERGGGIFSSDVQSHLLAVIVRNSVFADNYLRLIKFQKLQLYCSNCTFTSAKIEEVISPGTLASFRERIPEEIRSEVLQPFEATLATHFESEGLVPLKPNAAQLRELAEIEQYSLISLFDSRRSWTALLPSSANSFERLAISPYPNFWDGLRFGEMEGVTAIFAGLGIEDGPRSRGSKLMDSRFEDLGASLSLDQLLDIELTELAFERNTVRRVSSLVFKKRPGSTLWVSKCNFTWLGDRSVLPPGEVGVMQQPGFLSRIGMEVAPGAACSPECQEVQADGATRPEGGESATAAAIEGASASDRRLPNASSLPCCDAEDAGRGSTAPRGLLVGQAGQSTFEECIFDHIVSLRGLFDVTDDEALSVSSCRFSNIAGIQQSALLFAIQNLEADISFTSSTVENTLAKQGLMSLTYAKMTQTNMTYLNCHGLLSTNGFSLIFSQVNLSNLLVNNTANALNLPEQVLSSVEAGFLSMSFRSGVRVFNSTFAGLLAAEASFLMASGKSSVVIGSGTSILNSTSGKHCIAAVTPSTFEFQDSRLIDSDGIAIREMGSQEFLIANSEINPNETRSAVLVANSRGTVRNVTIIRGQKWIEQGVSFRGITVEGKASRLSVIGCTFSHLLAESGAGVSARSVSYLKLERCTFFNNSALMGGGLEVLHSNRVELVGNSFSQNKAKHPDDRTEINVIADHERLRGGAVFLDCVRDAETECLITFSSNNTFLNNYARIQGGAVSFTSAAFKDDGTTYFEGNEAGMHSADIATYPFGISLGFDEERTQMKPVREVARSEHDDAVEESLASYTDGGAYSKEEILVYPSGQKLNITVYLRDMAEQLLTHQNEAVGTLSFIKSTTHSAAAADHGHGEAIIKKNKVQIIDGVFRFTEIEVIADPGSVGMLRFEVSGLRDNGIPKDFVVHPRQFGIYSRKCQRGEDNVGLGTCMKCGYGFYLLQPPERNQACLQCHIRAICYGEDNLTPRPGFYRRSLDDDQILECLNAQACLGGDVGGKRDQHGFCAEGYRGYMCSACDDKNSRSSWTECAACGTYLRTGLHSLARLLGLTLLVLCLLHLHRRICQLANNEPHIRLLTLLKLMINHCVILSVLNGIQYGWSPLLQLAFDFQDLLISPASHYTDFECLLLGPSGQHDPAVPSFFKNLIVAALSPVLFGGWMSLVVNVMCKLSRTERGEVENLCVSAFMITTWLLQPDIAQHVFASFSCIQLEPGQPSRLYSDLEIVCWDGAHLTMVAGVSVPCILVWFIWFPLFVMRQQYHLQCAELRERRGAGGHSNEGVLRQKRLRYGFFQSGERVDKKKERELDSLIALGGPGAVERQPFYKKLRLSFEVVLMQRKLAVILAVEVLASVSSQAQVQAAMLLIIVGLAIIMHLRPHNEKALMRMLSVSQAIMIAIMYSGLYFITGKNRAYMDESSAILWAFLPLSILPSLVFLLWWLKQARIQLLVVLLHNSYSWFKLLTLNLIDPLEFSARYVNTDSDEERQADRQQLSVETSSGQTQPGLELSADPAQLRPKDDASPEPQVAVKRSESGRLSARASLQRASSATSKDVLASMLAEVNEMEEEFEREVEELEAQRDKLQKELNRQRGLKRIGVLQVNYDMAIAHRGADFLLRFAEPDTTAEPILQAPPLD